MAHKMGAGSTKNTRDSQSKRLGVKCIGTQKVKSGFIIVRQRGTKFKPGIQVGCGKDHTLYALKDGIVNFTSSGFVNIIQEFENESENECPGTEWDEKEWDEIRLDDPNYFQKKIRVVDEVDGTEKK